MWTLYRMRLLLVVGEIMAIPPELRSSSGTPSTQLHIGPPNQHAQVFITRLTLSKGAFKRNHYNGDHKNVIYLHI